MHIFTIYLTIPSVLNKNSQCQISAVFKDKFTRFWDVCQKARTFALTSSYAQAVIEWRTTQQNQTSSVQTDEQQKVLPSGLAGCVFPSTRAAVPAVCVHTLGSPEVRLLTKWLGSILQERLLHLINPLSITVGWYMTKKSLPCVERSCYLTSPLLMNSNCWQ